MSRTLLEVFANDPGPPEERAAFNVWVKGEIMSEYGIFCDEGIVESGFSTMIDARDAIRLRYDADDEVHAAECCHDHPEQERTNCEHCNADEEEDGEEDAE